jgi:chromosome segregation ATPase
MILHVYVVCIHAQSRITALESKDTEMKNEIERLQNDHSKLQDAYNCLEKEKLKLHEEYNCREKELQEVMQEVMDEAKAWGWNWLVTYFANLFTAGSSKGSRKAVIRDMRAEKESLQKEVDGKIYDLQNELTAKNKEVEMEREKAQSLVAEEESLQKEVDRQTSELKEMQTKLTAKDHELERERTKAQILVAERESLQEKVDSKESELREMQSKLTAKDDEVKLLEEKLVKLQGVLEQEGLNHDAEMPHQSAETAKLKGELEQERLKHDSSTKAMRATKESFLLKEVDGKKESLHKEVNGKESDRREMQTKLTSKDAEMKHQSAEAAEYTSSEAQVKLERAKAQSLVAEKEILQKEVDGQKSELRELQTKLSEKADELELERAKTQRLVTEKEILQKEVDGKHDAQASTKNDSSVGQVRESQLRSQTKGLEAIEQERDFFHDKAESLQKQVDELRHKAESLQKEVDEIRQNKKKDADELSQLGTAILKFAGRRNEESCPSGASTQAEAKTDV